MSINTGDSARSGQPATGIYAARLRLQRCKVCWNADGFNFHVPDWLWEEVVPLDLRGHVVCLGCFDDFALAKGVNYQDHLDEVVYFAGSAASFVLRVEARAGS